MLINMKQNDRHNGDKRVDPIKKRTSYFYSMGFLRLIHSYIIRDWDQQYRQMIRSQFFSFIVKI